MDIIIIINMYYQLRMVCNITIWVYEYNIDKYIDLYIGNDYNDSLMIIIEKECTEETFLYYGKSPSEQIWIEIRLKKVNQQIQQLRQIPG